MAIFIKLFIFIFVFVTRSLNTVSFSTSAAQVYFADHCASIAPHYSTPHRYAGVNSTVHRLTGFYDTADQNSTYGDVTDGQNSIVLRFRYDGAADEQGLYMVQGTLQFPSDGTHFLVGNFTSSWQSTYSRVPYGQRPRSFRLNGVWSESSGELCMVGSASNYSDQGNLLTFPIVLKLHKLKRSSSLTSLISGTLESLASSKNEPNYVGPISMSMLPSMNYQYTVVSNKSHNSYPDESDDVSPNSLKIGRFCSVFSRAVLIREFQLRYSSHCGSAKNCSPLAVSDLPHVMSLKNIECLEDRKWLRLLVDFTGSSINNQRPFDPSTTLVGEGLWDSRKNQLHVVACRFLNARNSLSPTHVGDCSTRLTLSFPAIWTIGNTSCIVGEIWSNKSTTESGYFKNITFDSGGGDTSVFQGQRYEYTKIDEATKLCSRKKPDADDKNKIYPSPFSYEMRLDISTNSSTGEVGWGYMIPFSVDNQFIQPYWYSMEDGTEKYLGAPVSAPVDHRYNSNRYNISYRINIKAIGEVRSRSQLYQPNSLYEMGIFAEGIYDDRDGNLCMVGCRSLSSNSHSEPSYDSADCEIVVNIQFPPTNPKTTYSSFVKGSIESTREPSDPLYFERLYLTSAAGDIVEASQSIWRMDVEIILIVISNTFACVFGALQLFHVKRHPDVLPSISILMLFILALGYMIPLMLNFDAMFTRHSSPTVFLGRGWLELNEVIVRVVTMVGFLLQIRLLQLTMSAKSVNGNQKELWAVEKLALFVALPVYVAGCLVGLFLMNWGRVDTTVMVSSGQEHQMVGTILGSCGGLVLDAFLFPQILLNMFSKSIEKVLSDSFYIGTTLVRVLPHAYDLYRAHTSAHQLEESYIYASPAADFYSTAWNVIIPCGCILFAVIIYLQQRFGGPCILPKKYEQVPIASEAS
uniref:uncharacterized protein LOC105350156 n=1 Tax=Fragaria vesca subsp. vesca TaxID=101020 RepID=UPI0005C7F92E|nr:PREDICTED: uncharacterized protein LOC105350156 [Fragaria vesca subsp. vesca]